MKTMNAPHFSFDLALATLRRTALAAALLGSTMLVLPGLAHATPTAQPTVIAENAVEGTYFRTSENAGEGTTLRT